MSRDASKITKSKKANQTNNLNSPRHFLQLMMRIMYVIFKSPGPNHPPVASPMPKQTNDWANYNLSALSCMSCTVSFNIHQSTLSYHTKDKSKQYQYQKLTPFKINPLTVSQKPECFNQFPSKLETFIGSLLPLSDKIWRDFLFSISALHHT